MIPDSFSKKKKKLFYLCCFPAIPWLTKEKNTATLPDYNEFLSESVFHCNDLSLFSEYKLYYPIYRIHPLNFSPTTVAYPWCDLCFI